MLKNAEIKPITGSFVNMLISDTGIVNAGLKEWEQDFRMMKAIGMDHLSEFAVLQSLVLKRLTNVRDLAKELW